MASATSLLHRRVKIPRSTISKHQSGGLKGLVVADRAGMCDIWVGGAMREVLQQGSSEVRRWQLASSAGASPEGAESDSGSERGEESDSDGDIPTAPAAGAVGKKCWDKDAKEGSRRPSPNMAPRPSLGCRVSISTGAKCRRGVLAAFQAVCSPGLLAVAVERTLSMACPPVAASTALAGWKKSSHVVPQRCAGRSTCQVALPPTPPSSALCGGWTPSTFFAVLQPTLPCMMCLPPGLGPPHH